MGVYSSRVLLNVQHLATRVSHVQVVLAKQPKGDDLQLVPCLLVEGSLGRRKPGISLVHGTVGMQGQWATTYGTRYHEYTPLLPRLLRLRSTR